MVSDEKFNRLVKDYNKIIQQRAQEKNEPRSNEVICCGELSLSSNRLDLYELSDLIKGLLKDQVIKKYLDIREVSKLFSLKRKEED